MAMASRCARRLDRPPSIIRTVSDQLCPSGVVVSLPDAPLDDHIGVVEVLIQEGLTTFALPASCEAFADVVAIFGARATPDSDYWPDADRDTTSPPPERGA